MVAATPLFPPTQSAPPSPSAQSAPQIPNTISIANTFYTVCIPTSTQFAPPAPTTTFCKTCTTSISTSTSTSASCRCTRGSSMCGSGAFHLSPPPVHLGPAGRVQVRELHCLCTSFISRTSCRCETKLREWCSPPPPGTARSSPWWGSGSVSGAAAPQVLPVPPAKPAPPSLACVGVPRVAAPLLPLQCIVQSSCGEAARSGRWT